MAYYRSPEWRELLEAWDEWWLGTTEFLNDDGMDPPHRGYGLSALDLVAGIHDLTRLDPQPVWDLYLAVDGWHKRVRPESLMYEHRAAWPIERIHAMAERVILHQIEIRRLGVVKDDPSTVDSDSLPDGPLGMRQWRHNGIVYDDMPPKPWLTAQALFVAENWSLYVDALYAKVEPEDHAEADRDKPQNWAKKANKWFRDNALPWAIGFPKDHYVLRKTAGSSEEPEGNP